MPLHLKIENEASLPDGGPIAITVTSKRGVDIGRDEHLDWCLPDPSRAVSGKHCEVRFRDGRYWLTDVSTNGTFVNRGEFRIDRPHALQSGDTIEIGRFIISVRVETDAQDAAAAQRAESARGGSGGDVWNFGEDAAPAINPRELRTPISSRAMNSNDVLDWAADIAAVSKADAGYGTPAPADDVSDWAMPRASAPAPAAFSPPLEAPPPVLTPAPARPAPRAEPAPPHPAPVVQRQPSVPPISTQGFAWDLGDDTPAPTPKAAPEPAQATAPVAAAIPAPAAPDPAAPPAAPGAPRSFSMPPLASGEPAREPWAEAQAPVQAPPVHAPPAAMPQAAPAPSAMRPRAAPPPAAGAQSGAGEFRRRFAKGAGLSEAHLAHHDDGDLAELLGQAMSIVAENLRQLHAARAQSKGMMRSSNQTMIQALDNNPLRFTPSAEEALRIMFGPANKSYLDASRALESSFTDLKKHQVQTFSAMQAAVRQIMAELEPKAIEAKVGASGGVSALMGGRKAKLWEHYATVWEARAGKHEQGMLAVFMLAFADAYDKSS